MDEYDVFEDAEESFDFQLPIQQHSRPISRMSGDLAFSSNLISVNLDDIDIDQNLIAVARNLGIDIPEEPVERKSEGQSPNISAVTVSSTLEEPSILQSRTSDSTRPTSIDSDDNNLPETPKPTHIPIESLFPSDIPLPLSTAPSRSTSLTPSRAPSVAGSRAPSLAPSKARSSSRAPSVAPSVATSVAPSTVAESVTSTSRSVFSVSNMSKHSSVASSLSKSLRRLSGLSKRKSMEPANPTIPQAQAEHTLHLGFLRGRSTSTPQLNRPSTADGPKTQSLRSPSTLSAPLASIPPYQVSRKSITSMGPSYAESRGGRGVARRPLTPTIEEEDFEEIRLAQERSLRNNHLQKLRITQLEEQARFIQEHYGKQRKVKDESKAKLQKAQDIFEKRRDETIAKHETANAELEIRHLHAELELERVLASQRRACETRLKYMEAYCYGKPDENRTADTEDEKNYPPRKVTEDDYRKLVEQYHLRNGMDTLHKSRINVLREQQAIQANRISIRQDGELDGLSARHERESTRLRTEVDRAEQELKRDYHKKKSRMIWRWKVKEAIERRRLELERGQVFGELPDVSWPGESKNGDDRIMAALGQGQRFSFLMS